MCGSKAPDAYWFVDRINENLLRRIEMRSRRSIAVPVALACVMMLMTAIAVLAQGADNAHPVTVPQGTKQKIQGVVSVRNGHSFKVRDLARANTIFGRAVSR